MMKLRILAIVLFLLPTATRLDAQYCEAFDLGCDCCCNDLGLMNRDKLTGDWGGYRSDLACNGITVDLSLTQFYQGVTSGGRNETFRYGGKMDYIINFSGQQAGLTGIWEGFFVNLHAETRYGEDINGDAVGLAPSNINMIYPNSHQVTAITGLQITQALSEEWAVAFGKFNALDLFQQLYPQTGRGIDGFMNASMILPLNLSRTVPLAFLGAGVLKLNDMRIQGALIVYDSNIITTTTGFDELFDNGANILGLWRFFTDVGGLPGSHAFIGTYATGDFTSLDPVDWVIIPGQGIVAGQVAGSWSATYILDQKLWVDCCDSRRNFGLLAALGFASQENSPFATTLNLGVQGQGLVAARPQDTWGAGYFYTGLSSDFKNLLSVFGVSDLQGAELYYNAAITPWFHLTTDLQIVEPAISGNDPAVVLGVRAKIDF